MKLLLQVLFFVLASTIEVEVRAAIVSVPNQDVVTQEPADCLWADSTCAMKTQSGRKYETKIGSTSVLMGPDTIIVRLSADSLLLVEGEVWVKSENSPFKIRTEYGDAEVAAAGEAWLVRSEKRVLIRSMRFATQIHARKSEEVIPLQPGFEVYLEGITSKGFAHLTIPSVLDFRDHMRRWARLYRGPKKEFVNELQRFDPILREAAVASSELHVELAKRYLASEKASDDEAKLKREQYERESARLRKLFRDRLER